MRSTGSAIGREAAEQDTFGGVSGISVAHPAVGVSVPAEVLFEPVPLRARHPAVENTTPLMPSAFTRQRRVIVIAHAAVPTPVINAFRIVKSVFEPPLRLVWRDPFANSRGSVREPPDPETYLRHNGLLTPLCILYCYTYPYAGRYCCVAMAKQTRNQISVPSTDGHRPVVRSSRAVPTVSDEALDCYRPQSAALCV